MNVIQALAIAAAALVMAGRPTEARIAAAEAQLVSFAAHGRTMTDRTVVSAAARSEHSRCAEKTNAREARAGRPDGWIYNVTTAARL